MSELNEELSWLLASAREANEEKRNLTVDPGYVLEAMEALETAQARIAELQRERDDHAHAAWLAQMRVAALEAAQRPPLGYVGTAPDGSPRAVFEDIEDARAWVAEMIATRGDCRYGYVSMWWKRKGEVQP